jgi:hypothetical protein
MFVYSIVMYKNVYASQLSRAQYCAVVHTVVDWCPPKPIATQSIHEIALDYGKVP